MNELNNIWAVLITLITTLGGTSAFRYYEKRALKKEKDENFIRHDCKDRISKLEALLETSSKEKDELRLMILQLTKEVATLRTKVEFFENQNKLK